MTELLEKRLRFTRHLTDLIVHFNQKPGVDVAYGRDFDEQFERTKSGKVVRHMRNSLHYLGLANDVALYINGEYQELTEAYAEMGAYWKSLDADNRWGGDFRDKKGNPIPDGCHFSITYQGRS